MATRKVEKNDAASPAMNMVDAIGGGEDPGLSLSELSRTAEFAFQAELLARESVHLYGEWLKIMLGTSEREIPAKDTRFADPAASRQVPRSFARP